MQAIETQLNTSSEFFTQELSRSSHDFAKIAKKILEQERISVDDGVQMIESNDLILLGHMANYVRERKAYQLAIAKGFDETTARQRMTQVWWNTNLHLNPTNVCIAECDFCSFAKRLMSRVLTL